MLSVIVSCLCLPLILVLGMNMMTRFEDLNSISQQQRETQNTFFFNLGVLKIPLLEVIWHPPNVQHFGPFDLQCEAILFYSSHSLRIFIEPFTFSIGSRSHDGLFPPRYENKNGANMCDAF